MSLSRSGVFIVNFEHNSHHVLVFLLFGERKFPLDCYVMLH